MDSMADFMEDSIGALSHREVLWGTEDSMVVIVGSMGEVLTHTGDHGDGDFGDGLF